MSDALNIITSCPKRRKFSFKFRKFFAKFVRSKSFELRNQILRAMYRSCFNEQMNMVGHNFHFPDFNIKFFCFLLNELFAALLNFANENFSAILRTPDKMIRGIEYTSIALFPSIHKNIFLRIYNI